MKKMLVMVLIWVMLIGMVVMRFIAIAKMRVMVKIR